MKRTQRTNNKTIQNDGKFRRNWARFSKGPDDELEKSWKKVTKRRKKPHAHPEEKQKKPLRNWDNNIDMVYWSIFHWFLMLRAQNIQTTKIIALPCNVTHFYRLDFACMWSGYYIIRMESRRAYACMPCLWPKHHSYVFVQIFLMLFILNG